MTVPQPRKRVVPPIRCISRRAALLAAYRKTASIRAAAEITGISPTRHYHWLGAHPAYRLAFAKAQQEVADVLQDELVERALEGWVEPVFYRGHKCGTTRHYSDRLLILLLKACRPEKYGVRAPGCPLVHA